MFSRVLRVGLAWPQGPSPDRPHTVIVKLPGSGPSGLAGRQIGAYSREALAYRHLVPGSPVLAPTIHLIHEDGDGGASLVMEDLGHQRAVDQLTGLSPQDGLAVVGELAALHRRWAEPAESGELTTLGVRRHPPATLAPEALDRGLATLDHRWSAELDPAAIEAFRRLVNHRPRLVEAFAAAPNQTLCHGDPRADNLVFTASGRPVLFDWQQVAVQPGEADLAWLAATSFTVGTRRSLDRELAQVYGTTGDRYRLGFLLPGLTVLLLAQRDAPDKRTRRFILTSLRRIGAALVDLDVSSMDPPSRP